MFKWGMRPKVELVKHNPFAEIDLKQVPRKIRPRFDDLGVTEEKLIAAVEVAYPDRETVQHSTRSTGRSVKK